MREYKNRTRDKRSQRPNIVSGRVSGHRLPTDIRKRELRILDYLYSNDWGSWTNQFDLAVTWYGYKLVITIASLTAFFTGIGQVLLKLMG